MTISKKNMDFKLWLNMVDHLLFKMKLSVQRRLI